MVTHGSWGYGHSKHHYKTCPFCYQNHQCTVVFYSHNFISLIPPMIKLNFLGLTQQKLGQTDRQTLTYLYLRITGKLPEIKNYILAFICTDSLITLHPSTCLSKTAGFKLAPQCTDLLLCKEIYRCFCRIS